MGKYVKLFLIWMVFETIHKTKKELEISI